MLSATGEERMNNAGCVLRELKVGQKQDKKHCPCHVACWGSPVGKRTSLGTWDGLGTKGAQEAYRLTPS